MQFILFAGQYLHSNPSLLFGFLAAVIGFGLFVRWAVTWEWLGFPEDKRQMQTLLGDFRYFAERGGIPERIGPAWLYEGNLIQKK